MDAVAVVAMHVMGAVAVPAGSHLPVRYGDNNADDDDASDDGAFAAWLTRLQLTMRPAPGLRQKFSEIS
ncbi:MAG: hypothetical protein ACXVJB_09360 [Mucilaginibacter sp.]